MTEPENFLTRWSRRKRVAEVPDPPVPNLPAHLDSGAPEKPADGGEAAGKPPSKRTPETADAAKPGFDPTTLPSIDSIGAQSDISAFLKPGVAGDLRLAALRRAWSMDPAIRDFKGLAENDWDFTAPNSMLGFGELDLGTDIKKMLAEIFTEAPRPEAADTELPGQPEQPAPPSHELNGPTERAAIAQAGGQARALETLDLQQAARVESEEIVQREENIASRDDDAQSSDAQVKRRRSQGGALPQ